MRTKICGIRNLADAQIAIDGGASAVGFLVGITHIAEDKITADEAKAIIQKLPPFVSTVMVTHLTDADEIIGMAQKLGVTTVQIHDYVEPDIAKQIKDELRIVKTIKAIPVVDKVDALEMTHAFQGFCDALLLDSVSPGRIGGTGEIHDWKISREIVEASELPVFLAGGLKPENVGEAVRAVRPFGVDVNSGVEVDGFKDLNRVKAFVRNAQLS